MMIPAPPLFLLPAKPTVV